jgi:hypothetical protein
MSRKNGFVGSILALIVILAAFAPGALAVPIGYVVDNQENLSTIDLSNANTTLIGGTGVFFEGLALSPGGTLYGTDDTGNLWTINTTTAVPTLIGGTGLGDLEALAFNGSTLVTATNAAAGVALYSLNTSTAAPTLLANTSPLIVDQGATSMTDIDSTTAFIIAGYQNTPQTLDSVNLSTGAVTTIGSTGLTDVAGIFGLALSGGTLYGVGDIGNEYTLNQTTGAATPLAESSGDQFFLDLTLAPEAGPAGGVPEPATLTLLGLGLAGLIGRRMRRSSGR